MTIKTLELIHKMLEVYCKTTYDAWSTARKGFERQRKEAPDSQNPEYPAELRRLNDQLKLVRKAINEFEAEEWGVKQ